MRDQFAVLKAVLLKSGTRGNCGNFAGEKRARERPLTAPSVMSGIWSKTDCDLMTPLQLYTVEMTSEQVRRMQGKREKVTGTEKEGERQY